MNALHELLYWLKIVAALVFDWFVALPLLVVFTLLALPGLLLLDALDRYRERWRDEAYEYARADLHSDAHRGRRSFLAATLLGLLSLLLPGCTPAPIIQPVRYQPVDVLVVKPCLAARKLPEPAQLLTEPACTKSAAECVRDAAADLNELKREARESRNLLKECSR